MKGRSVCKLVFQISFLEMENLKDKKVQNSVESKRNQQEKASMDCEVCREQNFCQQILATNMVEHLPRPTGSWLAGGLVNSESQFWKDIWKYISEP